MATTFDFNFTQDQLAQILGGNQYTEHWYEALCKVLPDYDITSVARVAAFMGQTMVESAGYTALIENLNYKPESLMKLWHTHFPTEEIAMQYGHHPEQIANRAYAGRMGNGDEASGDGWNYCGRGLIQITGKDNYNLFAQSIDTPLEQIPEFLGTFEGAVQSACWFWENNNLNALADAGDILTMTKKINGGTIGLEERTAHYHNALQVLQG
jgi:putative chitinase